MNNYINYSPFGAGDSDARHGYNGEIGKNSKYLLGEGNRLYISSLGVFNQKDNLNVSNGGGVNTYIYGNQNPINQYDPSGNSSTGFYAGNIIGIAAGIAGIVFAIPTGGASLSVSGGVSIALASAEVAATTASVALYSTDHQEGASITGWVAMGLGLASLGSSSISAFSKNLNKATSKIQKVNGGIGIPLGQVGAKDNLSSIIVKGDNIWGTGKNRWGLLESEDFANSYGNRYVYRLDEAPPEVIQDFGFDADKIFLGVQKMIEEDTLIVSQSLEGLSYEISMGRFGYIYRIDASGIKGVSLDYNIKNNRGGLLAHKQLLGCPPDILETSLMGADNAMEAHLDVSQINENHLFSSRIHYMQIRI